MRKEPPVATGNARERILEAAVEVIAQHGYAAAGVQEIVSRSGTSKGSFYFHFPSKEQMVTALVDQMSEKLVRRIEESTREQPSPLHRVAAGIEALMSTFSRQSKIAQVLLINITGQGKAMDKKFLHIRDRFSELIRQEMDAAVVQGQIEPQDTALMGRVWIGALYEVIMRWLLTGQPSPLSSATPDLRKALLRSVGADPNLVQPSPARTINQHEAMA